MMMKAIALLLAVLAALAAGNYNDGIYLSLSTSTPTRTYGSSLSTSTNAQASVCSNVAYPGQWFSLYIYNSGTLTVTTCGTPFDTVLELEQTNSSFSSGRQCLAHNDDAPSGTCTGSSYSSTDSKVQIAVVSGRTYYVLLRPLSSTSISSSSSYTLTATLGTNDCAKAASVTSLYAGYTHTFSGYIGSTYDHTTCTSSSNYGTWYSFKAPEAGKLHLDTCGTNFDTVLEVEIASCSQRTCVGTYDDDTMGYCSSSSNRDSVANVNVLANKVYNVFVRGYSSASSMSFTLRVTFTTGSESSLEASSDGVCPSSTTYLSTYGANTGYISSTYDSLPSGCWSGRQGEWWTLSYVYSDYLYVCAQYPVTLTAVSDLCTSDAPTCGSSYTTSYSYYSWCDGYATEIYLPMWSASSGNIKVLVSSSYDYVSYSLATSSSYLEDSSSGFHWTFSSDTFSSLFWIIFTSVCCGLGVCLCMVGICVCLVRCCRRRRAVKYAALPVAAAPAPVHVTIQASATAPAAETTPLTTPQAPPSHPAPPPAETTTPQGPAQVPAQPQLPPPPPGYQYVFLPSPYGFQGQQGAPATAPPALYPAVN